MLPRLEGYHRAIAHLRIAAACAPDVPPVFLALGIACQLAERLDDAREAFSRALTLDPDYTLAFNSLAMTQKLAGEYDKAAHNYDGGCMALARRLVKAMRNDRSSPIAKHRETRGQMWIKYALYGALRLVSTESGVSALVLPSGSMALREELDEYHAGLYWTDQPCKDGLLQRLMLPNFFNTFRDSLMRESSYSTLIGNRSTVLQLLGRPAEAALHLQEAHEFARKDA